MIYSFLRRKKEIDRMLMDMIESQEKSTEDEGDKELENGTNEMNGVEQDEGDKEDEESSEVLDCYLVFEISINSLLLLCATGLKYPGMWQRVYSSLENHFNFSCLRMMNPHQRK